MNAQPVVVWTEIPVSNRDAATTYYEAILKMPSRKVEMGGSESVVFGGDGGVGAELVEAPGKTGSDMVVHIAIAGKIEDAVARVTAAGGTLEGDIQVLPIGRVAYTRDPDHNRIGLFEAAA